MITYIHNNIEYDIDVNKEFLCNNSQLFEFLFSKQQSPRVYSHANINHEKFIEFLSLIRKLLIGDNLLPCDYIQTKTKLIKCDSSFLNKNKNTYKIYADINYHSKYYLHIDITKIEEYIMIAKIYHFNNIEAILLGYIAKILENDAELSKTVIEYYYTNGECTNLMDVKECMCQKLVKTFNDLLQKN